MLQKEWQRKQKVSFYCMQLFIAVGWMWPYTENIAHSRHGTPRAGGMKSTAPYDAVSLAWRILFSWNSIYTLMNVSLGVFPFSQPLCFITKEWEEIFFFFSGKFEAELPQDNSFSSVFGAAPCSWPVLFSGNTRNLWWLKCQSSKVAFLFSVKGTVYLHSILALIKQSERN